MTDDRLLTIPEAGKLLALKPVTVRKMIREGDLPSVRPLGNRTVRVRLSDVRAIIAGNGKEAEA